MESIINIDANVKRIKEFFEFSSSKLDFNNSKVKLVDELGNLSQYDFQEAKKILDVYYKSHKYPLVAQNSLFILGAIPERLQLVNEKLTESFEELIKLLDIQNQSMEELEDEIALRDSEIKDLELKLEILKQDTTNDKFNILQSQMNSFMSALIGNNNNNLQKNSKFPSDYFTENIETQTEEENISINESNIQKTHNDVLNHIKEENLYPLHKINPDLAKIKYKELWMFLSPKYDLNEEDYPKFIDNLSDYSDKDDDYLDEVGVV